MPVVAVGCTGPQSCERDQTVFNAVTGRMTRQCATVAYAYRRVRVRRAYFAYYTSQHVNLPTTDANGIRCITTSRCCR